MNVPQGWSSYVVVTAIPTSNLTNSPILQVVDFNQKVENFQSANNEKFYFITPGGSIKLSTQSTTVSFQFSVQWYSNIAVNQPRFLNLSASDSQPIIVPGPNIFDEYPLNSRVTAETRASVITIPSDDRFERAEPTKNLRSILIFDGPNENSTCLGTAYQLLNSNRQWVSTGKFLTIVQLQPLPYVMGSPLLIQDFENTKEFGEYRVVGGVDTRSIVMDASKQASAFSTYSPLGSTSDCLINITGTGTLEVYYGGITESKSNLIATYPASSTAPNLPQILRGVVRTYVLTGGIATVHIARYGYFCNIIEKNLNGFITSTEYRTNLSLLTPLDSTFYYSKEQFNYTLNVQNVDLSQNKSLQLKITNNKTDVLNVVYNSSNPPMLNTVFSGVGTEMEVSYSSPYLPLNAKKDGFYIDFTATKVKWSTAKSFSFIEILRRFFGLDYF
ncbi:Protein CBG19445 [Caenorhabditis briggsae]|nr:Protein CBG19445 [Caenorhabditis briggsae]CAP36693.2 Protein CBG19445 [Caenorhabditis briggsae]